MIKKILKISFFICFFASVALSFAKSQEQILKFHQKYANGAIPFLGMKFSGLNPFLKNSIRIGYLTDSSLDETTAAAEFAQAQYILAPIILEFNNPDLRFVLVNGSSFEQSLELIRQNGLNPIKGNQFQIILTQNPKFP